MGISTFRAAGFVPFLCQPPDGRSIPPYRKRIQLSQRLLPRGLAGAITFVDAAYRDWVWCWHSVDPFGRRGYREFRLPRRAEAFVAACRSMDRAPPPSLPAPRTGRVIPELRRVLDFSLDSAGGARSRSIDLLLRIAELSYPDEWRREVRRVLSFHVDLAVASVRDVEDLGIGLEGIYRALADRARSFVDDAGATEPQRRIEYLRDLRDLVDLLDGVGQESRGSTIRRLILQRNLTLVCPSASAADLMTWAAEWTGLGVDFMPMIDSNVFDAENRGENNEQTAAPLDLRIFLTALDTSRRLRLLGSGSYREWHTTNLQLHTRWEVLNMPKWRPSPANSASIKSLVYELAG